MSKYSNDSLNTLYDAVVSLKQNDLTVVYKTIKKVDPVLYNEFSECLTTESFISKAKEILQSVSTAGKWKIAKLNLLFKKVKQAYTNELPAFNASLKEIQQACATSEKIKQKFDKEDFQHDTSMIMLAGRRIELIHSWFSIIQTFQKTLSSTVKTKAQVKDYSSNYATLLESLRQKGKSIGTTGLLLTDKGYLEKHHVNQPKNKTSYTEWLETTHNLINTIIPNTMNLMLQYDGLWQSSCGFADKTIWANDEDPGDFASYEDRNNHVGKLLSIVQYFDLIPAIDGVLWKEIEYLLRTVESYITHAKKLVEVYR